MACWFSPANAILLYKHKRYNVPMVKPKQSTKHTLLWHVGLSLAVLVAAVWVLASHWQTVRQSLQVARGASIGWLALSLFLMACTFCVAAAIYGVLALHRLRYWQTVLVEVSTACVNRLLPSGLGGLGLHGVYLYKRKHTAAEATVVVSMNNLLGIVAHLSLLGCVLAFRPSVLRRFIAGQHLPNVWIGVAVLVVVALLLAMPALPYRALSFAKNLGASVHKLRSRKALMALLLAMLLTTTYTLILFSVTRSLQLHLDVIQVFIVFSLGMLTSTATPTPGGLVGAEAGLFAGFVAYGVAAPLAGAAVLLYRLVTYWIPLIPGLFALFLARRRKLV